MANLVKIYKSGYSKGSKSEKTSKVIALDLDETLGEFSALVALWQCSTSQEFSDFCIILDCFPEFMRCGIMTIMEYLYKKKQKGHCSRIFLYTNNRYSPNFPQLITHYFSEKMGGDLFDKTICAFKVGDKIIEPERTSHQKTHGDFIKCTLLPKSTEICFIDDVYHENMNTDKIYYIQPFQYYHALSAEDIVERAVKMMPKYFPDKSMLVAKLSNRHYHVSPDYEIHTKVSQKIMYYIKEFFYLTTLKPKTRKHLKKTGKHSRKDYLPK